VQERYPGRLVIGEDLQNDPRLTRNVGHGGAGFGSQWDPSFLFAVRAAAGAPFDECRSMARLREALCARYNGDAFQRVVYVESHDDVANGKVRLAREVCPHDPHGWHGQKRATLAAALTLTAPGIPLLFQGQEFLATEGFSDAAPLDWGGCERHGGVAQLYRDLIALRLNRGGVSRGLCGQHVHVHHVNDTDKLLAYHRWDRGGPKDSVVVVANFSHRPRRGYVVGFPQGGRWRLRFNSDWRGYSGLFGDTPSTDCVASAGWYDGLPYRGLLDIGPYSALVFSQGD